ncbi:hypothetical protein [Streptomyces sp. NPDC016626]|uniref:hypothetical protein n=1 Tax=Streptomyces sp. NPDC016626 TaxID=3364968 RepID=UPI0036F5186C
MAIRECRRDERGDLYGAGAEARVHVGRPFSEVGGDESRHGQRQAEADAARVGAGGASGRDAVFLGPEDVSRQGCAGEGDGAPPGHHDTEQRGDGVQVEESGGDVRAEGGDRGGTGVIHPDHLECRRTP